MYLEVFKAIFSKQHDQNDCASYVLRCHKVRDLDVHVRYLTRARLLLFHHQHPVCSIHGLGCPSSIKITSIKRFTPPRSISASHIGDKVRIPPILLRLERRGALQPCPAIDHPKRIVSYARRAAAWTTHLFIACHHILQIESVDIVKILR